MGFVRVGMVLLVVTGFLGFSGFLGCSGFSGSPNVPIEANDIITIRHFSYSTPKIPFLWKGTGLERSDKSQGIARSSGISFVSLS